MKFMFIYAMLDAMTDLIESAAARIEWTRSRMRLLADVREEFARTKPFEGRRIGMSLHIEPKTAVLLETLAAGGAEIVGTGNHGSTQDDVVAFLRSQGMTLVGRRDDSLEQHHENVAAVLDASPGGTLIGGTEETTSGGDRLRAELAGRVPFPVIVINDSLLKQIGENRHAVGQSVVESFMRITNLMVPGRRFVVVGYGWCGRGVAQYLRALGGKVAVAEIDEIKAFEAALDGYRVDSADNLAEWGEVFITATGRPNVLTMSAIERMNDGAILANCGHFPWEIDTGSLRSVATSTRAIDDTIERIELPNDRHVILIAGGRMFNLAGPAPKGNSLDSMDLGFLLQVLSLERVATGAATLLAGAQPVPDDLERQIAQRMVAAMGANR
jgi:adenosylhomocysteinase